MVHILSCGTPRRHRVVVTYPCSSPALQGACVGELWLRGATVSAGGVDLDRAEIGDLILPKGVGGKPAPPPPPLSSARGWQVRDIHGGLRTDRAAAARWLDTADVFTAQPYEELARVYDRNGQPADARRLRFHAARRATTTEAKRHPLSFLIRTLYGLSTGFGYYPLLALVWLLACGGTAYSLTATHRGAFTPINPTTARTTTAIPGCPAPDQPLTGAADPDCLTPGYPPLNPATYAITTVTPASALTPPAWTPTTTPWLETTLTLLKITGWLLTTLLLAGITGLLRKG